VRLIETDHRARSIQKRSIFNLKLNVAVKQQAQKIEKEVGKKQKIHGESYMISIFLVIICSLTNKHQ